MLEIVWRDQWNKMSSAECWTQISVQSTRLFDCSSLFIAQWNLGPIGALLSVRFIILCSLHLLQYLSLLIKCSFTANYPNLCNANMTICSKNAVQKWRNSTNNSCCYFWIKSSTVWSHPTRKYNFRRVVREKISFHLLLKKYVFRVL